MISNARLFRLLQRWVRESYPGDEARAIAVKLRSGDVLKLAIPSAEALRRKKYLQEKRQALEDRSVRKFLEFRRKIFAVLSKSDGKPIQRKKLFSMAGYNSPSYCRAGLASLRKEGAIVETREGITLPPSR